MTTGSGTPDATDTVSTTTDTPELTSASTVTWCTVDSPVGRLLLASSPAGLLRVAFGCEDFSTVLDALTVTTGAAVAEDPADTILSATAAWLNGYFAGTRRDVDVPLDFTLSASRSTSGTRTFRQTVQRYLPQIGYGQTRTYKEVAGAVGNPKAARAVGTACATNPLPIVVPCHRVLRSDGTPGGYLGGPDAKRFLLELELEQSASKAP